MQNGCCIHMWEVRASDPTITFTNAINKERMEGTKMVFVGGNVIVTRQQHQLMQL